MQYQRSALIAETTRAEYYQKGGEHMAKQLEYHRIQIEKLRKENEKVSF
jgi:hypothetical protein